MATTKRIQKTIPLSAPFYASVINQERQTRIELPILKDDEAGRLVEWSAQYLPDTASGVFNYEIRNPSFHIHLQDGDSSLGSTEAIYPGSEGFVDLIQLPMTPWYEFQNLEAVAFFSERIAKQYTIARSPIMPRKPVVFAVFPYNAADGILLLDFLIRSEAVDQTERLVQLYSGN